MDTTGWQEARWSPRKRANWPVFQLSGVTHCNTLQHTATHCNTLQHTATHCKALQHIATHCNTLQHTATHCKALQHIATHCNTLHTMQHPATHCNKLQHIVTHYSTLHNTGIRPTQSMIYVPLLVNRFQKSVLLFVQYKQLKSCSGDLILQNVILRTRSCGTLLLLNLVGFFISTDQNGRAEIFCTIEVLVRRGISGAPALKYLHDS